MDDVITYVAQKFNTLISKLYRIDLHKIWKYL